MATSCAPMPMRSAATVSTAHTSVPAAITFMSGTAEPESGACPCTAHRPSRTVSWGLARRSTSTTLALMSLRWQNMRSSSQTRP